jgi:hypothetical protein
MLFFPIFGSRISDVDSGKKLRQSIDLKTQEICTKLFQLLQGNICMVRLPEEH